MRSILRIALLVLSVVAYCQDDPDIVAVPVRGLEPATVILSYAFVTEEAQTRLVVEARTAGTTAFYMFDYVDDALVARTIGPRSLTAELLETPTHLPDNRSIQGKADSYWRVGGNDGVDLNLQLVSAPSLEELLYADVSGSPWQLTPPPDSRLSIVHRTVAADGTLTKECLLEPNISAAVDRVTTSGAWWVNVFGEPELVVGYLQGDAASGRRGSLRVYDRAYATVALTGSDLEVDANSIPDLVTVDLSGDGTDELLFFSTASAPDSPLVLYRFVRRSGAARILSFSLCSVRMNGADVSGLQRALVARGYSVGSSGIDGWYGPDTRAAVIRYQRDAMLDVNGIVSDEVWHALGLPAR